jgi:hypothetical protein
MRVVVVIVHETVLFVYYESMKRKLKDKTYL